MMRGEEGIVISGLLVGLNVIDCNFDLKGEDIDTQVSWLNDKTSLKTQDKTNTR